MIKEKQILIVIVIILSILIIRYFYKTYESFQNNDIEYGIIHMTTADMTSIKNNNNATTHNTDDNNLWNNEILTLKDPSINKLVIMPLPPADINVSNSSISINLKPDLDVNNEKLNGILPDKKMIGSFIFNDSFDLNKITNKKTIKLLRYNSNDTTSSFGRVSNELTNYATNNFTLIGSIGKQNVINSAPIYGMNIGFNTSKESTNIDNIKAINKVSQIDKIISDKPMSTNDKNSEIEKYLKNKIFKNSNNTSKDLSNLDLIILIKRLPTTVSPTDNALFYDLPSNINFYDNINCASSQQNNNYKVVCFGKAIYEKMLQYITDNGMYNNISINFMGINQLLNKLQNNLASLKYYNNESNNVIHSDIYTNKNLTITGRSVQNYPASYARNEHNISNQSSTSLTIKIPIGYKVRLQKYLTNESKATLEFVFPFTNYEQVNSLYKSRTAGSIFDSHSTSFTSYVNEIVVNDNNIPLNYQTADGLKGKIIYQDEMFYMEIININQGSTPTFNKMTIELMSNTLNGIKNLDTKFSIMPYDNIFSNQSGNSNSHNINFQGIKSDIIRFYNNRNTLIKNFTKLKNGLVNTSELFNPNSNTNNYNSLYNKFKVFKKYISDANVPKINFYKLKNNKVGNNHIVVGDIAVLDKFSNQTQLQQFFNKYTTIPKHCYKEIRDWDASDRVYEQQNPYLALYKNEYLNTFIVMNEKKLPDGKMGTITPCPDHSYRVDNLIKDNNEALIRCKKYKKMKDKNPIFNTEDDDLIDESLETKVYEQEKKITMLKEYANRLHQENSKAKIINQEYNRSRLTEYLDKQKTAIDNAVDKLIDGNNKIDININYKIKVLDDLTNHVIEADNTVIPFETKKKLVKKISEVKKTSLHGDEADKKIDEIISECPTFNMEGYFKRDPPCLGCSIPRDQT